MYMYLWLIRCLSNATCILMSTASSASTSYLLPLFFSIFFYLRVSRIFAPYLSDERNKKRLHLIITCARDLPPSRYDKLQTPGDTT
jgi:hypothetical protein